MNQKVSIVYFSPTGNTRKTLEAMAEAVSNHISSIDLSCRDEVKRQFSKNDLVLFGMPVYGGRIPAVAKERMEGIMGDGTPCLVVVSYGNRDYDDALLELADFAKAHGFVVKGAAAVVGRHTYGEIQINRPDETDLMQGREFAMSAVLKSENAPEFVIPGNFPYKDGGMGGKFRPLTSSECIQCGRCVRECPVHAIGEDCVTTSEKCLSCFRCIRYCPVNAKNMDTEEYRSFSEMFTQKLSQRRENQYFV